jgi:AAA family ATP:ADP antiporter
MVSVMHVQAQRSPWERFLGLFTEVRAGEGATATLLMVNVFLLLGCYYVIKPVREALILTEGGAEIKSYLSAGQTLLLIPAVSLYSMLAARYSRRVLLTSVTLFFTGCLVLFYFLGTVGVPLGIVFFLWVGIFNLMIVAQFWSLANDLYTPGEGKRLFPFIAFGASAGAVVGSMTAGGIFDRVGLYPSLLVAAAVLFVALGVTWLVLGGEGNRGVGRDARPGEAEEPLARGDAFRLVFRTPYLLLIAFLILFLNWVNTNGEFLLGRIVLEAADLAIAGGEATDKGVYIGVFYAGFFQVVNLAALAIQLFLVSRILKFLGVRIALLILPVIALGGYATLAFLPVLGIVRWIKTAENATDYSLQNTLRGILFLPTTREEKYKAKQAIDTFFVRAGDFLSGGLVALGLRVLMWGTTEFALFNLALTVVWLALAALIGRRYHRLVQAMEGNPPATSSP